MAIGVDVGTGVKGNRAGDGVGVAIGARDGVLAAVGVGVGFSVGVGDGGWAAIVAATEASMVA